MKKTYRLSFGTALYLISFLAVTFVSSAQVKLRDALDFDGDDKADFAVWRETDGAFYILRSADGGLIAKSWGLISDFPIASYDTH